MDLRDIAACAAVAVIAFVFNEIGITDAFSRHGEATQQWIGNLPHPWNSIIGVGSLALMLGVAVWYFCRQKTQ